MKLSETGDLNNLGRFLEMAVVRPLIAPLQPSGLRTLSGPGSPASPLSPLRAKLHLPPLPSPRSIPSSPAFSCLNKAVDVPPEPMPWLWSCHKCHSRYALGATRRCLHDGHYFCGGITVNKVTGKTKKHKACASEFDYVSWEDYGKWKRRSAKDQSIHSWKQHCENECDFPSACHWKTRNTPKKSANFEFLDPNCLGTEPTVVEAATRNNSMQSFKKTGLYIDKIVKAAEKRTSQLTTLLSTIEEERNCAFMPGYVPAPTSSPPKLPELPSLSGLGLSFPVIDFSAFNTHHDDNPSSHKEVHSTGHPPASSPPSLSTTPTTTSSSDTPMTD